MKATTTSEERNIFVFIGEARMVNEKAVISWSKLGSHRVLNRKTVFFRLVHC